MRKKYLILPIILTLFSLLYAGAPDTLWTRTYGGTGEDIGYSVQQTDDGGFIIAGYTKSFGVGNRAAYIIRTDPNGDTLWTKTYGEERGALIYSLDKTSNNGFVFAGESWGPGAEAFYYVIRTDSNGDSLWTKTYGGNSGVDIPEYARSVSHTNDGGFIIVGVHWRNVYLVKTDSNGDTLWTKTYGGDQSDQGYSVKQTNDGGFIISGYTDSYGPRDDNVYLIRTNENGDSLWTKTYGGDNVEEGFSVIQTFDSGFIVVGCTHSFGAGKSDIYIIRTDSNGDSLWTKTYGGLNYDGASSVLQMNDSGFIIAGGTNSFEDTLGDVYLIRTDSNGDSLWTKTYGSIGGESTGELQQTNDGGFIIVGSAFTYVNDTFVDSDVYLIRLDKDTTAIQKEIPYNFLKPNNFIVSNNNGNISIRYTIPYSTSVKLEAYDIKGKRVRVITDKFMQKGSYSVMWDSKRFGSGVYYIKLSTGRNTLIQKAIIIK